LLKHWSTENPTTVTVNVAEAAGLSDDWLAARQLDAAGRLLLRMDDPTVLPLLQNGSIETAGARCGEPFKARAAWPTSSGWTAR